MQPIIRRADLLKSLKAYPAFAAFAVLTLALSVGANVAVFSLVNAIWLKPRPVVEPDRVVMVTMMDDQGGNEEPRTWMLPRIIAHQAFESAAGQVVTSGWSASHRPRVDFPTLSRSLETAAVTWQYFGLTGLRLRGRDFAPDDDMPGAEPVAIISDGLWREAFDGSPEIIGTLVDATPMRLRIVGVAPEGFRGLRLGERTDIWIPRFLSPRLSPAGTLARSRERPQQGPGLLVFGRLRAGLPLRDAQVLTAADLGKRLIPINDLYGTPDRRSIVIGQSAAVWMAAVTAALLLLAGSATLMALVVVHLERRRQELAVRTALGCSAGRMVAMLIGELALVAAAGLAGALATGVTMLRILPALRLPGGLELSRIDMSVDWRVLAAGAGSATIAIALGAITPIRRVLARDVAAELGVVSGKATTSSFALRRGAIVFHVAATVVVLVAAGLFVRTVVNGLADAPGFEVDRTLFLQMTTRLDDETTEERDIRQAGDVQRLRELRDRLAAMPGVEAVSIGNAPIGIDPPGEHRLWPMTTNGRIISTYVPSVRSVDPSYFDTLGIRLLAGRALMTADWVADNGETVERPAVITRELAETLWPGALPIGQSFGMAGTRWQYHVVGVVGDHVARTLTAPHRMGVYFVGDVASAVLGSEIHLAIRTRNPASVVEPIRRLAAGIFPQGLDLRVVTGRELVRTDLGSQRLAAWLFTSFGVIAVVIGLGGVFGLVGYLAESRRREMGIRLALGAAPGQILRTLLAAGLAPVAVGVVTGVAACLLLVGYVESRLVGVSGWDPLTYAAVVTVVLLPAGLAGLAAAWRIRRVSASEILHAE